MVSWWLNLSLIEHILFAVALASTVVVITKAIFIVTKFYCIDKLNSEPDELENFENIANSDSDIQKHVPSFISVMSVNVFLASASYSFFLFEIILPLFWSIACGFLFGLAVLIIYGIIDHYNRKKQKKSNQYNL